MSDNTIRHSPGFFQSEKKEYSKEELKNQLNFLFNHEGFNHGDVPKEDIEKLIKYVYDNAVSRIPDDTFAFILELCYSKRLIDMNPPTLYIWCHTEKKEPESCFWVQKEDVTIFGQTQYRPLLISGQQGDEHAYLVRFFVDVKKF